MRRIITLPNGTRYRCEGVSRKAMMDEITMARATGSIGGSSYNSTRHNDGVWISTLIASVHQINSDYSDRQPYGKVY